MSATSPLTQTPAPQPTSGFSLRTLHTALTHHRVNEGPLQLLASVESDGAVRTSVVASSASSGLHAFAVGEVPLASVTGLPDITAGVQVKSSDVSITPYVRATRSSVSSRPTVGGIARVAAGPLQLAVRGEYNLSAVSGALERLDILAAMHGSNADVWSEPEPSEVGFLYRLGKSFNMFYYRSSSINYHPWRCVAFGGELSLPTNKK